MKTKLDAFVFFMAMGSSYLVQNKCLYWWTHQVQAQGHDVYRGLSCCASLPTRLCFAEGGVLVVLACKHVTAVLSPVWCYMRLKPEAVILHMLQGNAVAAADSLTSF